MSEYDVVRITEYPSSAPFSVCYLNDLSLKICDQEQQAKCYF